MDSESMMYVYPQEFPIEKLVKGLREHGVSLEGHLDGLNNEKCEEILLCFHQNLASLPRRHPHNNRRGATIQKKHNSEDKKLLQKISSLDISNTINASSTVKSKSYIFQKDVQTKSSNEVAQSTPEMDRLQARSKAVLESKRKLTKEPEVIQNKVSKVNQSLKTSSSIVTDTNLSQCIEKGTKTCLISNKRLNEDSILSHNSKKMTLNVGLSNHKPSTNVTSVLKKVQPCNENDLKTTFHNSNSAPSGRKKLKRPSFA